jgi:predicted ATPase/DNA-binding winged helix-turn-helix (wHTH) protein
VTVSPPAASLRFGRFEIQVHEQRLLVDGRPAELGMRALALLTILAQRPGQLVTKRELLALVWPGLVVEENNIAAQISALRKVLGGEVVTTIPGRGYSFVARIETAAQAGSGANDAPATDRPSPAVAPAPARLRTNLPESRSPLIGRDADLAAIGELIAQHRLVSIVGAGGMGKTRLAQALLGQRCADFAHGVCFVELTPTATPESVPGAIAAALGVNLGDRGEALAALADAVAPLAMLVALDNAEHLIAAVAQACDAMLAAAPQLRVVVTSQLPLKLADERVYRLGALAVPATVASVADALNHGAIALFNERAQAVDRHFSITPERLGDVVELCRRLDGVALAIELAAARLPLLGLPRLVESLDQRLKLLTGGSRTAPARQQTLRAALEWSCALLSDVEQAAFRRLAVFAASASLVDVQYVVADDAPGGLDEWAVLDALGTLVDRSLVEPVVDAADEHAEPRYRLLATPQAYALELLGEAGEIAAVQRRHAQAMRRRFEMAQRELLAGQVGYGAWEAALRPDLDNGRAAVAWATVNEPATVLAIAPALGRAMYWDLHRERVALTETVEALLDSPLPSPPAAQPPFTPDLIGWAALQCSFNWTHSRPRRSLARAQQALAALGDAGDLPGQYLALAQIVGRLAWLGEHDAADQAVALMQQIKDPTWPATIASPGEGAQALARHCRGDHDGAMAGFRRQLDLQRAAGSDDGPALTDLANSALAAGRVAEAVASGRTLVERLAGTRRQHSLARARLHLFSALLAHDEVEAAREVACQGWPQARRFDLQNRWADALALLAALESRGEAALRLVGYADAGYAARDDRRQINEQRSAARAEQLARAALAPSHGTAGCDCIKSSGCSLRDDAVAELAFGTT